TLWSIVKAISLYAILWAVLALLVALEGEPFAMIPRSVVVMNWLLALIVVGGIRMMVRWLLSGFKDTKNKKNIVIYGAGSAGRQLSIALTQSNEYLPVALLDDNYEIQGQSIYGLEVCSPDSLASLIKKKNVIEVFLAMPELSRSRRNSIVDFITSYAVIVRSLPSVSELAQGKVKIEDLREINIKDLLGRDPVSPNTKLLKTKINDKSVLVTGAGGSIGSELCRQILLLKPKNLILFDVSESSLYQIEQELLGINSFNINIFPMIGSVLDRIRMESIFKYFEVDTIYHAAAYKHVPLVEYNQSQGILNNAIGTLLTAETAIIAKVKTFVLISTDKAVRPTNTMGATKRIAELIIQALSQEVNQTSFTMVRFGNVLDSSGSVIPLFKKQIKNGGPLTITDKNIVRYFMTISEAVELVIQAGAMNKGGDLFVLDMGEPVRINDLAKKMIQLSGLKLRNDENPEGDIEIKYVGLRPGEKLYEELLVSGVTSKTENPLIMSAREKMIEWTILKPMLEELIEHANKSDQQKIREMLIKIVPEYSPQSPIVDLLFKK
ncbi:polysaccharide biosynthesis protein, partial [Candidatus Thioglobus sp.]|nr:polysaccharide biosynthesis protein [Candidatus Thioglobus sp.]